MASHVVNVYPLAQIIEKDEISDIFKRLGMKPKWITQPESNEPDSPVVLILDCQCRPADYMEDFSALVQNHTGKVVLVKYSPPNQKTNFKILLRNVTSVPPLLTEDIFITSEGRMQNSIFPSWHNVRVFLKIKKHIFGEKSLGFTDKMIICYFKVMFKINFS